MDPYENQGGMRQFKMGRTSLSSKRSLSNHISKKWIDEQVHVDSTKRMRSVVNHMDAVMADETDNRTMTWQTRLNDSMSFDYSGHDSHTMKLRPINTHTTNLSPNQPHNDLGKISEETIKSYKSV